MTRRCGNYKVVVVTAMNCPLRAAGCLSAMYDTNRINYSHVCGRVIGYGYNSPGAFEPAISSQTIEGPYVDGLSLTHGPPGARQHIWTFAAGGYEVAHIHSCPCASETAVPTFVGNDYFCESGNSPGRYMWKYFRKNHVDY